MDFSLFFMALAMMLSSLSGQQGPALIDLQDWRQMDFNFPTQRVRNMAVQSGFFFAANVTPIDVDVDYRSPGALIGGKRVFVTTPRFTTGVPVTLGYVIQSPNGPLIQPYPDYSWHSSNGADCDGITSAFRVAIDACNQMWVVDSGVINGVQKCQPEIIVFNLNTDTMVHRYRFPQTQYTSASLFITPVIDTNDPPPFGRCTDTKVYIADVTGYALIVYDSASNRSWKIKHKLFEADPQFSTFLIAGEDFNLSDGLFNFALTPRKQNTGFSLPGLPFLGGAPQSERLLYFHSLASATENAVPLRLVNDASIWEKNQNAMPEAFQVLGSRGVQTPAEAMDSNGNLFFVLVNPLSLVCWDSSTPYNRQNIRQVYRNDATLQFASGLKILRNNLGVEELWVMTNRFQKISDGTLNPMELNFRIQGNTINELLRGDVKCNGTPI